MSAFQVSAAHLVYIIGVLRAVSVTDSDGWLDPYAPRPMLNMDCEEMFADMARFNVWNLAHLYPKHTHTTEVMPDDCPFPASPIGTVGDIVKAIKLVDCFVYQCCDMPGWDASRTAASMRQLREILIRRLPGYRAAYDAAPWSI